MTTTLNLTDNELVIICQCITTVSDHFTLTATELREHDELWNKLRANINDPTKRAETDLD